MRKSVFEFIGLFVIALIIVSLVVNLTITGFAVNEPSETSTQFGLESNGTDDESNDASAGSQDSQTDPEIDEIINSDPRSDNEFESTETDDLDGFNLVSIEAYTSENLEKFPWISMMIGLAIIVLIALGCYVLLCVFTVSTSVASEGASAKSTAS